MYNGSRLTPNVIMFILYNEPTVPNRTRTETSQEASKAVISPLNTII